MNDQKMSAVVKQIEITRKQVFSWAKRTEAQELQKTKVKSVKETMDFNRTEKSKPIQNKSNEQKQHKTPTIKQQKSRYRGSFHPSRQCLVYGKTYSNCGKETHFRIV